MTRRLGLKSVSVCLLADVHLQGDAVEDAFVAYLSRPEWAVTRLYVLGDLFEAWLGDDISLSDHARVVDALRALVARGVGLFFMHGNRDFLLGEAFAAATGGVLLAEPQVVELAGTPTLLMHGDALCVDDKEYQAVRAQVRDPAWQQAVLARPAAERRRLAAQYREESRQHTRDKPEMIMDVNPDEVVEVLRRHGVTRLIHGHTHRPAVHEVDVDGLRAQRIVLPDWRLSRDGTQVQGGAWECTEAVCALQPYTWVL